MSGCSSPAGDEDVVATRGGNTIRSIPPAARGRLDRSGVFQSNGGLGNCPIDNFNRFHKTGRRGSNGRKIRRMSGRLTPIIKPRATDGRARLSSNRVYERTSFLLRTEEGYQREFDGAGLNSGVLHFLTLSPNTKPNSAAARNWLAFVPLGPKPKLGVRLLT